jgi:hypothetical protein
MALLYICSLPSAFGMMEMADAAHTAWQQLVRLDEQYHTLPAAATRLEGQGWVSLVKADTTRAAACFEQAAALWADLGHLYDQTRSVSGLAHALTRIGDEGMAELSKEKARELVNNLAARLDDQELKKSFLDSALVRKIRDYRTRDGDS